MPRDIPVLAAAPPLRRWAGIQRRHVISGTAWADRLADGVRTYDYVFFAAFLLVPSLIWIALDQSAWAWDAATYGERTVELYYQMRNHPSHWPNAMRTVYPDRAPGICWFGQFFVPLGQMLGSIEVGLLLSILVCQWITLILVYRTGREMFPTLGRFGLLAGCLLVGSAPIFVGMSQWYMTEALQILGVAWMFHAAACCPRWDRLQTLTHLIAGGSLVLLSKVTTPAYCFLPGLLAVASLWRHRGPQVSTSRPHRRKHLLAFLASLGLLGATLTWYGTNGHAAFSLAYSSAVGLHSVVHGHPGTVGDKLLYWIGQFRTGLCTGPSSVCLVGLGIAAAGTWLAHIRRRGVAGLSRVHLLVAAAFLHLAVFLCLAITSNNINSRFVSPLLPAVAILCMAALAAIGSCRYEQLFAAIFLAQWIGVSALSQIVPGDPTPLHNGKVHVHRPLTDPTGKREAERLVALISDDSDGAGRLHMVGVEDWRLNAASLNYIAAKEQLRTHRRAFFATLDYPPSNDLPKVWQRLDDFRIVYFATLAEDRMNLNRYNQMSPWVAARIAADPRYRQERFPSELGMLLYRRQVANVP